MPAGPAQSRYVVEWYTPSALGREITDMATSLRRTLAAMPADARVSPAAEAPPSDAAQ
jgi:hypothetical protein